MATPKDKGTSVPVSELLKKNAEMVKNADSLYSALNYQWHLLEQAIVESGVLKPISIEVFTDDNDNGHFLAVEKISGKWRIAYASYYQNEELPDFINWTPVVDCPLWVRESLLKRAPELVKAIYESNASVVSELSKCVEKAEDFLKLMGIPDPIGDI